MPDIMGDYNWSNEEYEPKVSASSADEAMRKALALFGPGTTLVPRKQSSAAD